MLEAINNRELGFMEILSITTNLFIKNIKMIIIVVAVLFFPISILNVLIVEKLSNSTSILLDLVVNEKVLEDIPYYTDVLVKFIGNHALQMTVLLFLEPVGIIAIAKIAKGNLCNESIRVRDAIGEAMNCLWGVIITGIPYWFLVFFGSLFFIIPGIYLGIIWTFYVYAIGLTGIKGWKALVHSKKITKNRFWKTLGFIIVTSFIVSGWNWIFNGLFVVAPENIATNILYTSITYISGSFGFIGMTVLFMNREAIILGEKHHRNDGNTLDGMVVDDK